MPFQPGNKLAANRTTPKEFENALRLAIKETHEDKQKLRLVAEALIDKALLGDVNAIREVANRLDGMPKQTIDTTVTHRAEELSDDELAAISAGGGEALTAPPADPPVTH